jgi:LydA holin phage, holin superfamily III
VADYSFVTYAWVLGLSLWGGTVNYLRRLKLQKAQPFSLIELIGDLTISGFSGMITFYLCEASKLDQILTAAIVGIAGHMGSRTIFLLETLIQERLLPGTYGKPEQKQPPENHC